MKHFPERDPAKRRVDEVVERRLIRFAEVPPGAAPERGQGGRFPEIQPVGSPGREVVVPLIGVADLVDRKSSRSHSHPRFMLVHQVSGVIYAVSCPRMRFASS